MLVLQLFTHLSSFKLSQILHVPEISTNLLFVHQFAKDNDCSFLFDSNGFSIPDRIGEDAFLRIE